jgi:hypothetical protein
LWEIRLVFAQYEYKVACSCLFCLGLATPRLEVAC